MLSELAAIAAVVVKPASVAIRKIRFMGKPCFFDSCGAARDTALQ
jgi:hypothetical protein